MQTSPLIFRNLNYKLIEKYIIWLYLKSKKFLLCKIKYAINKKRFYSEIEYAIEHFYNVFIVARDF